MPREPGYCRHKATGQAYVNLGGKVIYLGAYGTPESHRRYDQLKAEWLTCRHNPKFSVGASGATMAEVCLAFLDHAESYYRGGSEYQNLKLAIVPISELYAEMPALQFGVLEYKRVRDWWLSRKSNRVHGRCSRKYINTQMKRLKRIIKWAVGEGIVPVSILETLKCIPPLKRGRTDAPEPEPIMPVPSEVLEQTLPQMSTVVRDLVRFQLLVGCRPGEVVTLKPSMIDRTNDVWIISLSEHKTAYREQTRTIYVGPQAQAVIEPYLNRQPDDFCFKPTDSERERRARGAANRRTPLSYGNRPGTNVRMKPKKTPGECYTTGSYARAIHYACNKAFPAPKELSKEQKKEWRRQHSWAPNQLRHSAATNIRREFGLDAASVILGHSGLEVTQIYAEQDREKAIEVARKIG